MLLAQGLSPSLRRSPEGLVLSVPEAEVDRALASLSAYEQENPRKGAEHVEEMKAGSVLAGVTVALMLLLFFSSPFSGCLRWPGLSAGARMRS